MSDQINRAVLCWTLRCSGWHIWHSARRSSIPLSIARRSLVSCVSASREPSPGHVAFHSLSCPARRSARQAKMDHAQLRAIFVREYDLLMSDVRRFVRTRIDSTTEQDTAAHRDRVIQYLAHAETVSNRSFVLNIYYSLLIVAFSLFSAPISSRMWT